MVQEYDFEYPKKETLNPSTSRERSIEIHYPAFHHHLLKEYPDAESFAERMYRFYNGVEVVPCCPVCGKAVHFHNAHDGYYTYCSKACMNASDTVKEHRRHTNKERYGDEQLMRCDAIKERLKRTNLERYGVENAFAAEAIKDKIRSINRERYGVDYPMQSDEVLARSSATIQERYGVEWNCQRQEAKNLYTRSKVNRCFEERLKENGIGYEAEYAIRRYSYDFKVGDVLVEIDPTATHNSTVGIRNTVPHDKDYHRHKSDVAEAHGYRCIHVFDWDSKELIIKMLKEKERLFARCCEVRDVPADECRRFLEENHLQGNCNGAVHRLGLYYDGDLVEIMTFGRPRYNRNYEYELLRLCSRAGYVVVGGAERLFRHFVRRCNPKSIISYCDRAKFGGGVYARMGFVRSAEGRPTRHWHRGKDGVHITDNLLRQKGYDKLFNAHYGKGTNNETLMKEHGFVEVYDCGQDVWSWAKK